jgi:phage shock protein PspC (stress-responsive transcriptional regulator)
MVGMSETVATAKLAFVIGDHGGAIAWALLPLAFYVGAVFLVRDCLAIDSSDAAPAGVSAGAAVSVGSRPRFSRLTMIVLLLAGMTPTLFAQYGVTSNLQMVSRLNMIGEAVSMHINFLGACRLDPTQRSEASLAMYQESLRSPAIEWLDMKTYLTSGPLARNAPIPCDKTPHLRDADQADNESRLFVLSYLYLGMATACGVALMVTSTFLALRECGAPTAMRRLQRRAVTRRENRR